MSDEGIESITPAEDSGSDTYRRFRAQAAMALAHVLGVILGQLDRVIMEHVDDFAVVRTTAVIELHQIKTRTDGGRWTLTGICSSNAHGRPLRRLLDRFRLVRHLNTQHFLHLQGEVDSEVRTLQMACEAGDVTDIEGDIARRLSCDAAEAHAFLLRIQVRNDVPHLALLTDVCMNRYIYPHLTKRLPAGEVSALHDRLLDRIGRAMEGAFTGSPDNWLGDIVAGRPPSSLVERKTLNQASLAEFAEYFGPASGALLRPAVPEGEWASALTEKLLVGGADATLLEHVQTLRASAYRRHIEQLTGTNEAESELDDVYRRLMSVVLEALGDISERPAPAARMFSSLSRLVRGDVTQIDQRRIFDGDTSLLLGAAFQLCDECRWRLD